MKKWMGLFFIATLLPACRQTLFQRSLNKADNLEIRFYASSKADSLFKIVHTDNPDAVAQMAGYIGDKPTTSAACGRDGKAVFLKGSTEIATVSFSLTACRIFEYTENGVSKRTVLSNEAFDFLSALKLQR